MSLASRAAGSLREFLESSRGAHLALESLCYFHATTGLTGYFLWADPPAEDLDALAKMIDASLALDPHPSLLDGRSLQSPPVRLFEHMARFVPERRDRFARSVQRLALVRPPGIVGATALGFFDLFEAPYPIRSFETLEPALEWLDQAVPADLAAELDEIAARVRGVPTLVHRLRAQLRSRLQRPDAAHVAALLGLSERTLHRRLADVGTTFGEEIGLVRIEVAKALLTDTDTPVTSIALDVGCASVSSFSILFRKRTGTTPSAYRRTTRAAAKTPP